MASLKASQFKILFHHFLLTFFQVGDALESKGFSLKLIPWDSPKSPLYQPNLTQSQKIQMMTMSSKARAAFLTPTNETSHTKAIQTHLIHTYLQYSVNFRIGNPGKEVTLLLDGASGFIWTQCEPVPNPVESRYRLAYSTSYKPLPCQHPMCLRDSNLCKCIEGRWCVCSVNYEMFGERRQHVEFDLGYDSFALPLKNNGLKNFSKIIFGCSKQSSGIVGLNNLPLSLTSQVRDTVEGCYSYCLHDKGGYLRYGIPGVGRSERRAKTTKILPDNSNIFLEFKGTSINKKLIEFHSGVFPFRERILIDIGTPYTVLKRWAYERVMEELRNYYDGKLRRVDASKYGLERCYQYKRGVNYFSMTFHLDGDDYTTRNLFVFPNIRILCIGLISGEMSILGALQQRDTRFTFDMNANLLQLAPENCARDGE